MGPSHSARRFVTAGIVLALLALFLFASPSGVHTPVASAQTLGCGTGQTYSFGSCLSNPYGGCSVFSGYSCSPYGSSYGCYGSYACSPYYGSSVGTCGTSLAAPSCSGSTCGLFGASCSGCGSSLFGAGCSGVGTVGSCTGIQLQAGQSCSNGVVTCTPAQGGVAVPCGGGGLQSCPATVITPACTSTPSVTTPAVRPTLPSAGNVTCPGGGYVAAGQSCSSPVQTNSSGSAVPGSLSFGSGSSSAQPGFQVSLASGWNLISGPGGTTLTGVDGSLYTFQAGDTSYETLPAATTPLKAGVGYWVNLPQSTQITLGASIGATVTVALPAGQFVMIGNPGLTPATVSGADTVLVYNQSTASYTQATQLQPGQGAWAMSNNGGQATITNTPGGQS